MYEKSARKIVFAEMISFPWRNYAVQLCLEDEKMFKNGLCFFINIEAHNVLIRIITIRHPSITWTQNQNGILIIPKRRVFSSVQMH